MKLLKYSYLLIIIIIFIHIIHIIYIIHYKHNIVSELIHDKYYEEEKYYNHQIQQIQNYKFRKYKIEIRNEKNKLIFIIPPQLKKKKIMFFIEILRYSNKKLDRFYCCIPKKSIKNILSYKELPSGLYLMNVKWKLGNKKFYIKTNIFI